MFFENHEILDFVTKILSASKDKPHKSTLLLSVFNNKKISFTVWVGQDSFPSNVVQRVECALLADDLCLVEVVVGRAGGAVGEDVRQGAVFLDDDGIVTVDDVLKR